MSCFLALKTVNNENSSYKINKHIIPQIVYTAVVGALVFCCIITSFIPVIDTNVVAHEINDLPPIYTHEETNESPPKYVVKENITNQSIV